MPQLACRLQKPTSAMVGGAECLEACAGATVVAGALVKDRRMKDANTSARWEYCAAV